MELLNNNQSNVYELSFHGTGKEYFGIIIVNWLLTIITLGIYYPWARARKIKYRYGSTELNGDRLAFHGTGQEMFFGFLKLILILVLIIAIYFSLAFLFKWFILGIFIFYLALFAIMPLAIHGAFRYRMSRTSWRGIRFGYRGEKKEFVLKFLKWMFLTIITLGLYGPWMAVNLRKYVIDRLRMGDIEGKYSAEGIDLFILNLKGYVFTVFTLGIYFFWWQRDLFAFYIDNISLHKDEKTIQLNSTATGGGFFKLIALNFLIVVFTLGLGYAWAEVRTMRFVVNNIKLTGDMDLSLLQQTEENYGDAMGEGIADFFDIDLI
jgi:uncharacterized membrane protein YjgN (DUF898 family)